MSCSPDLIWTLVSERMKSTKKAGWPVALYLAGPAPGQGSDARPETVKFDGGDRVVVEHFRDEFIQDAEEEARFLMETSILEELNGSLCDAVTGRKDSPQVNVEMLAAENTLVVPTGPGQRKIPIPPPSGKR